MTLESTRKKTITDFGDQWDIHGKIEDEWTSKEKFRDHFGNIFDPSAINNKIVCDVGSGCGRIIKFISRHNPKIIYAVEPSSEGVNAIKKNLSDLTNLKILNTSGELFKTDELCDYIISIGVIHHIKNPIDVLKNIRNNLKENGKLVIWVYGYENNLLYLIFYKTVCQITKKLPNNILNFFSSILNVLIEPYIFLCRFINLPLKGFLLNVFSKCSWKRRKYIIFDQLNPEYAHYYKKEELEEELGKAGFSDLKFYHRHKYSWTVVCEK